MGKLIHGKYLNLPNCCDCHKKLSRPDAERCYHCKVKFMIGEKAAAYKDGHTIRGNFCKDCNTQILGSSTRCKSCQWNYVMSLKPPVKVYQCEDCNIIITREAKKCGSCAQLKRFKNPENHPLWIDGRSFEPYPYKFNQQLKAKIRARDNYICQGCGMTEEEHLIVYGRILNIHHIDYNKQNCFESNLIATCNQCNGRANYNREYWKEFYLEKVYK